MFRARYLLSASLLAFVASCAQERPVINRVQAVALKKAFFVGDNLQDVADDPEFYMRGVITDVGYGAAQDGLFTSTYAQPVTRVRWEVTENALNARLAYERIQGTDSKGQNYDGLRKKSSQDGQIVASYRITGHFDIRRAYNPTTGEQLNIVEENAFDRPWYQREYFRVDWSTNLVTAAYDLDTLAQVGIYGGIKYLPIPYAITDEKHPDAPFFDMESGYFDITTKAFAEPQTIDLSHLGWGIDRFPACYLPPEFSGGSEPYGNCNPVELTLRHSFRKVTDTDFEEVDWDGYRFQAFGYFNYASERKGYDRNYGLVDNLWHRFAGRYNIWERSHYYSNSDAMTGQIACATPETTATATGDPAADPNRGFATEGTAEECSAVTQATGFGGSRCNIFKNRCTLPFRARQHKTIAWYINGRDEPDLFEATDWATMEWNLAMKTAVNTAKLVECKRTGGDDCESKYPMWTGQQEDTEDAARIEKDYQFCMRRNKWDASRCNGELDGMISQLAGERGVDSSDRNVNAIKEIVKMKPVIVLCNNPVTEQDHPACGPKDRAVRQGDLRYHQVLIIDKPQQPSSWGIMVDADDPLTGEKVAGSMNIWSHVTDLAVTGLVDIVRYTNGELPTEKITNGKYVHNWAQAQKLGVSGAAGRRMSPNEVAERLGAAANMDGAQFAQTVRASLPQSVRDRLKGAKLKALDTAAHVSVPSQSQALVESRMAMMRGTETEAKLLNPAILKLAGLPAGTPLSGNALKMASPMSLNNPKIRSQLRNMRENALAKRGACILHEAPEASALTAVADIMKRKFPVGDNESELDQYKRHRKMVRYLRRRFHYAVIGHEMGHSIGLRHNFVSSYGAMHFRPQYWQLRTRNGEVTNQCTGAANEDTANCVGPRYYDGITQEEQDQMIWMFMQSSVMDYPGDLSQDMIGLGQYDYAAARMLYGDVVSVHDREDIRAGNRLGVGMSAATDTFGGLLGIRYSVLDGRSTRDLHYSELQSEYKLIDNCYDVDPNNHKPAWWKNDVDGEWDPVMDGMIVSPGGRASKCRQMPVDYTYWAATRPPSEDELGGAFYRGGNSVEDSTGRVRVPYHFATDNWADLGNLSVFRHDNGADAYEQVQFLLTTQENRHIFDNFRRNRTAFSVKGAADRSFSRYNEKLVNIAGGMAFFAQIYRNFAPNTGYTFESLWPFIINENSKEQMVASSIAFDHLARQLARPSDGDHYKRDAQFNDPVLRSNKDPDGAENAKIVTIPNGTTGFLRDVGLGGRPMESALSESNGDYDVQYDMNAGSYYDKINSIIHMSLSEDRFISQSRGDFYDARFRANGIADLFPDGYRRLVANALVGDRGALASYLEADAQGNPLLDEEGYPARPMGHVSWWPKAGPQVCFPSNGRNGCAVPEGLTVNLRPDTVSRLVPVDPQVGWEVQKFVIAWVLTYITANQQTEWIDMMRIYRLGPDANPELGNGRLEFQDPQSGQMYYARSFGRECLFGTGPTCTGGKIVEKAPAARVLEWANELAARGYKIDRTTYPASAQNRFRAGYNQYGRAMWMRHPDGAAIVAQDPTQSTITPAGLIGPPRPACDQNLDANCQQLQVFDNLAAVELKNYKSVIDYLWEVLMRYRMGSPRELGFY